MRDERVVARALERGEAEQYGVIAELTREARLGDGLRGAAAGAGDHHGRRRVATPVARGLDGAAQHGLVEAGLADRELRGVHPDGEAAGTGIEVVARQRPLPPRVEPAARVERERMRRDGEALPQARAQRLDVAPV